MSLWNKSSLSSYRTWRWVIIEMLIASTWCLRSDSLDEMSKTISEMSFVLANVGMMGASFENWSFTGVSVWMDLRETWEKDSVCDLSIETTQIIIKMNCPKWELWAGSVRLAGTDVVSECKFLGDYSWWVSVVCELFMMVVRYVWINVLVNRHWIFARFANTSGSQS